MSNLTEKEFLYLTMFNCEMYGYYFDLEEDVFEILENDNIIFKAIKKGNNIIVTDFLIENIYILKCFMKQIDKIYIELPAITKHKRIKKFIIDYVEKGEIKDNYLIVYKFR